MVRRDRDVAIIVLKCVILGCCAGAQQAAFGAGMATPPKSAAGGYILVAQVDTPSGPQAIIQETKSADAPAEPQAVMQEIKSATRLSGSKQRRRKPKMAGVPAGLQVVAKETKEPEPQAVVKEAKEPELQTAAQEAEETGVLDKPLTMAQKTKFANAPAKPQAEMKEPKTGNAGKKKYGMAPIQWAARLSETAGWERHSQTSHPVDGIASTSRSGGSVNTQTAEIHARTYVLQPYIAKVSGGIGVVSSKNNDINSAGSRNNQLFGDGALSLFSQSRFPFNMSFNANDNRNNTELQTQDVVSRQMNLDQTYRPLGSNSMYSAGYMHDRRITTANGWNTLGGTNPNDTATHSFWRGGYSTSTPEHRIHAAIRYNEKTTSSAQNTSMRMDDFTLSDIYLPSDSLLSFDSTANLNLSNNTDLSNNAGLRASFLHVNTNVTWQPEDEDIPLFVDGNVRLFRAKNTVQAGGTTSSQSLSGNANARYLFSRNLTGNANGNATLTNSNGVQNLTTTQRGSVTYSSDAINLWKNSSYAWNANGGVSNQTGGSSDKSIFGGVGHGLSMPYKFNMFNKKLLMSSRVGQSLQTTSSRVNGWDVTLANSGSVSLGGALASVNPDKELMGGYATTEGGVNTTATLSANDTRTIVGRNPSHRRIYSLTIDLQEASKSTYSRYGIDLEATLGATQGTTGTAVSGAGTATYRKARVFNVRGLDYVGSLKISAQSSNKGVSDVNAQNPRFPWVLDQRLRYKIGQNELLLRGKISDQNGIKDASLWLLFRAWRIIGN